MREKGVHFYKFYKPAASRFMEVLTYLQRFKGFNLLCRGKYLKEHL